MTDKEKIRAEIERRIEELQPCNTRENLRAHGAIAGYYQILSFIDSMQEEPKFKIGDIIKPIDSCLGSPRTIVDVCDSWYVTDQGTLDFEYENNWELVEKYEKCMYSKDNYTNEDRKALCEGCEEECRFNKKEEPVSIDFEHELYKAFGQVKDFTLGMRIAKWFYDMGKNSQEPVSEDLKEFEVEYIEREKDNIVCVYDRHAGLVDGANWKKQQMMKEAIEAEIINWASMFTSIKVLEPERAETMIKEKFDIGDKVKLIIVKED